MPDRLLWQTAPYPEALEVIVAVLRYRDWSFSLDNYERPGQCEGLTLKIRLPERDTYDPDSDSVLIYWVHEFDVPARVADTATWSQWVLDCIMLAHRHEAMEQFIVNGERVFAPEHDVNRDLYRVQHVIRREAIGGER